MGLLRTDIRKLVIFNNASGKNRTHTIHAPIPPKNGDSVSASNAAAITPVHTANDHLAFASPNTKAPNTINQTSSVIEISFITF